MSTVQAAAQGGPLVLFAAPDSPPQCLATQATRLFHTGPIEVIVQHGAAGQFAMFQPAMGYVERCGLIAFFAHLTLLGWGKGLRIREGQFDVATQRRLVFTPKNGRWLNVAEIELSILSRQCMGNRRFASAADLGAALPPANRIVPTVAVEPTGVSPQQRPESN